MLLSKCFTYFWGLCPPKELLCFGGFHTAPGLLLRRTLFYLQVALFRRTLSLNDLALKELTLELLCSRRIYPDFIDGLVLSYVRCRYSKLASIQTLSVKEKKILE